MNLASPRGAAPEVRISRGRDSVHEVLGARIKITLVIASLICALLLNLKHITGEYYDYLGFSYSAGSAVRIATTFIAVLVPIALMPMSGVQPSTLVFSLLYLIVYLPSCVVTAFTEDAGFISAWRLQSLLLSAFAAMLLTHRGCRWATPRCSLRASTFWPLVAGVSGLTLLWATSVFGPHLRIPSFSEVYAVRDNHVELLQEGSRLLVYLIGWQANVINPLLLAHSWVSRRYALLTAVTMLQLWLFSVSGYKTYLLALPLVACVMLASRLKRPGAPIFALSAAMLGLVLLSSAVDLASKNCDLSNVFVRRLLLTPGRQTYWYYDFFSEHPKAQLGHSVLQGVVDYPYEASPPRVIGERHFKTYDANANGNLWADAYANFGAAGMIGFSALLGLFCWAYDQASRGVSRTVAFAMLAMPAASLCNSPLLTTMLTHGLGLSLLLVLLYPRYSAGPPNSDEPHGRNGSAWSPPPLAPLGTSSTSRRSTGRTTSASRTSSARRSKKKAIGSR